MLDVIVDPFVCRQVKRLSKLTPGDYELEIEGKGEVHIIVNAKSDINFQLGFSIDTPSSINDTVTRPPPGTIIKYLDNFTFSTLLLHCNIVIVKKTVIVLTTATELSSILFFFFFQMETRLWVSD